MGSIFDSILAPNSLQKRPKTAPDGPKRIQQKTKTTPHPTPNPPPPPALALAILSSLFLSFSLALFLSCSPSLFLSLSPSFSLSFSIFLEKFGIKVEELGWHMVM